MSEVLSARGLSKAYGPTIALADVDLSVSRGSIHALVGENGAGKSTLLSVLAGATQPDRGSMTLAGAPYAPKGPVDARRRGVAMVHQELAICPHLSVAENILLGDTPSRFGIVDRRALYDRAGAALAKVAPEGIDLDARAGDLAPAAQQLIEIARALTVAGERLVILDEPTSSLGAAEVARLFTVLRKLRDEGTSVLYVSHFLEEVMAIADRFTVLRDGRVVGSGAIAETSIDALVEVMAGRAIEAMYPRSPRKPGEVILDVRDLSDGAKLKGISFSLRRGEVLGIAGLVGAGRTELCRAIVGLDRVTRGEVKVGLFRGPGSPAESFAAGMGLLSEDRKGEGLALGLSIEENLTLARLPAMISPARQTEAARALVEKLAVKCSDPSQKVSALSGGNQQKVALGRLLHRDVDVALLDEPTRGVDVGSKAQIYAIIDALVASGKAVLVVSSYLPELFGVCDRIAVMRRGALGPARDVADRALDAQAILKEATSA